jgi:hypothetical protein
MASDARARRRADLVNELYLDVLTYFNTRSTSEVFERLVSLKDYGNWRRSQNKAAPNRNQVLRLTAPTGQTTQTKSGFIGVLCGYIVNDVFGRFNGMFSERVADELPAASPASGPASDRALRRLAHALFDAAVEASQRPDGGMRARMLVWTIVSGAPERYAARVVESATDTDDSDDTDDTQQRLEFDLALRTAMDNRLSDELGRLGDTFELILDRFGRKVRNERRLDEMVDALAAVLDGLLLRVGVSTPDERERWRRVFGDSVVAIAVHYTTERLQ